MLEDGTVQAGVNNLFRESVGDIMYVDLPCHETRAEHGRLFIRILAADKQMHKLYVPIRGRVVAINHEINFNTDLINKDPFGKGWIVRMEASNLEEDLRNWSGNISIFSDGRQAGSNSQNRTVTLGLRPATTTEIKINEKIQKHSTRKSGRRPHGFKLPFGKFLLSALASRLFFLVLLPTCLGAISRAVLCQVGPQRAD
jgi:glycine cleavage system H protein